MLLIGAGGHARAIVEMLRHANTPVHAYVDPNPNNWLTARHFSNEDMVDENESDFTLGLGGVSVSQLRRRLNIFCGLISRGWNPISVIHHTAAISDGAIIQPGAIVLETAIIQPDCHIGSATIINAGATINHGSEICDGTHIAPGAVVLAECRVGQSCMIGAGAVLLPGSVVPDDTLVPALTRYPK